MTGDKVLDDDGLGRLRRQVMSYDEANAAADELLALRARVEELEKALADEMGKTVELEDSLAAQKELTHESVERIIELEQEVERLRGQDKRGLLAQHEMDKLDT